MHIFSGMRFRNLPGISVIWFSVLAAFWLAACTNFSFWQAIQQKIPFENASYAFYAGMAGIYMTGAALIFDCITVRFAGKYLAILVIITAGTASFFMDSFGVHIDRDMLINVLDTDVHEASAYLTPALFWHLFLYVVMPSVIIAFIPLRRQKFKQEMLHRMAFGIGCIIIGVSCFVFEYKSLTSFFRTHREVIMLLNPVNTVRAGVSLLKHRWRDRNIQIQALGLDANHSHRSKPCLVVLVVGETARAANWGMNGYARNTTPVLAELGVTNFPDVTACGTATAVSLPCMFSIFGHAEYSDRKGRAYENLTDILAHAGVRVIWRDNNSGGSKGIADRVGEERLFSSSVAGICDSNGCHDEILLHDFDKRMAEARPDQDVFVILHQEGSHGPSYFQRYPAEFKKFLPECLSADFQQCTREQIVNTYDNTIVYTDYVLGEVIHKLQAYSQKYDTAMLYISDHGESLGEYGLYLHGIPVMIAPAEQTHVPMVMWIDSNAAEHFGIDKERLQQIASGSYSHDNLFHSILGLMGIKTSIYDASRDIFARCRKK